jgi:hypothetical protein
MRRRRPGGAPFRQEFNLIRFGHIIALALASTAAITAAQQPAPEPRFTADAVRGHVEFLASDLLVGRDAGSPGYDIAALYVATRFEALGLTQAVPDSWYQTVTLTEARRADPTATVRIGDKSFAHGGDVVVSVSTREPKLSVAAPAVFAGFGLDAPDQGFDDYRGLDVAGKYVVVLTGSPKGTPSEIGAHLAAEKAAMAEKRGAIGIIQITTRENLKRRPWSRTVEFSGHPALGWVGDDGKPYVRAPGIRASATLHLPAAEALFAGAPTSLKRVLDQADRQGGKPRGFVLAQPVEIAATSTVSTLKSPNVLAVLPGSDPALANEYVLLMAHLDHVGVDATKKDGDTIFNGALDNAAGTATMLEVARAFAESGTRPKRSILFAAVTAEEDGLLGSQFLAKHPVVGDGRVVGVVNLDMPVLLYDFQDVIAFGAEHSTLGPIVAQAAGAAGVKLSLDPMPSEGLFTRSDHYRFVQEGVPSVFLMTGFAGEGEKQFQDFLATHYHKVSDQTDLPIDWDAGAKFARINYLIARDIANAPAAPRWYADSFFGTVFAPDQEKATRPAP